MRRATRIGCCFVALLLAMVASCSGDGGSPFVTTGDAGTTSPGSTSSTALGSTSSPTVPEATTSTTAQPDEPSTTTTTSLEQAVGVAEAVLPDSGALVVSDQWEIAPADIVLVMLEDGLGRADADRIAAAVDGAVVGTVEGVDVYQIRFDGSTPADLDAAVALAGEQPGVLLAVADVGLYQKDASCESAGPLTETSYTEGTNARPHEMIGTPEAWAIMRAAGVATHPVRVGVMDDQLRNFSSEINGASKIFGTTAADTTDAPDVDDNGDVVNGGISHGTAVSQVIAADPDNGGVAGVASVLGSDLEVSVSDMYSGPRMVEVAGADANLLETFNENGKAYTSNTMALILQQIRNGATVINMSFGPTKPDPKYQWSAQFWTGFLDKMHTNFPGVIFVAAAGNEGRTNVPLDGQNYYPGGIKAPNLITVGGTNKAGDRIGFSNFAGPGGEVTLAAPAGSIPVGVGMDGKTVLMNGTSFSTPMVAAAAALLKSINPELSAEQVKAILVETAYPGAPAAEGSDTSTLVPGNIGGGLLRVDEAVLKVINDLRVARGDDPLDKEELVRLATVSGELEATGPRDFNVVAAVESVPDDGATLTVELLGEGILGGESSQLLEAAGFAVWTASALEGSDLPSFRVCRTDVGACCTLTPPVDIAGTWVGTLTMTEIELAEGVDLPDGSAAEPGTYSGDDLDACAAALGEAVAESLQQLRDGVPFTVTFTGSMDQPGDVILTSAMSEESIGPLPWRVEGTTIRFDYRDEDVIWYFAFEQYGTSLSGSFLATDGESSMRGVLALDRSGD